MSKNVKKRNWAFILYPDSAPSNWLDILQQTGLSVAISPLHNMDVNPDVNHEKNSDDIEIFDNDDFETKKSHYHVILCYSGPTSYNVVKSLTDTLNQPIPQALEQVRGYYRYFTHKDNPEKFQYDEKDIKTINGFNISDFVELTSSEIIKYKKEIQTFIRENELIEYADLMDILLDNDLMILYDVASNNTYFFDKYICSRRNLKKTDIK